MKQLLRPNFKAQIITHVKELDFALRMIWLGKGGVYLPSDLEALKGGNWFPINTDHFELLPGVNIYWVGGHTPGSIMLSVESEKGNVIFTGDFIHLPDELNVEMKGWLLMDSDEYLNGMKRLKLMMRRPNTKLVISHDPKIWEKYPKAPTPLIS
ncbi:MBL fold metallo-hydrolase [Candidatus Acidianus copahuensis]|uniref:MBL fold metallo-hydrolase n=1 Tax=Candidatus Acidianus copahuensis TaxID=1160895 RepID=UPI001F2A3C1B|nr:MBL fold metallo-hydrolase [Candidatus Acidianus copahuensis]